MANRATFGGVAVAVDFDFGGPLPGSPPPLVITSTPTTSPLTNPATFVVITGATVIDTAGIKFFPLNSNAPLLVGAGQDQETMTPSSTSNPTSEQPNVASFTGTFLSTHGQGDPVASGTHGLQEAINYMVLQGGGEVWVDQAWVKAGGTTAMYNAAVFNSPKTVTLVDHRTA